MKHILFVCTGNTCRSPMAEAMLRSAARHEELDLQVQSAGVSAVNGLPMSEHSAHILRDRGIAADFTSSQIVEADVERCDLIFTMTMAHKRIVIQKYPQAVDKIYSLKEYVEDNPQIISDISEVEGLYSEWQLKKALSQPISERERARILVLERNIPNFDIMDPYGGTIEIYRRSAIEIEEAVHKLVKKLQVEQQD